jgi:hypothetical protein
MDWLIESEAMLPYTERRKRGERDDERERTWRERVKGYMTSEEERLVDEIGREKRKKSQQKEREGGEWARGRDSNFLRSICSLSTPRGNTIAEEKKEGNMSNIEEPEKERKKERER